MNDELKIIAQVGNESARLERLGWFPTWSVQPITQSIVLRLKDGNGYHVDRMISLQCAAAAKFDLIRAECDIAIRELQSVAGRMA